ncbi:hypothetical protein RDWZM_001758 [Blomia tropicalis]|uniref:Uncharacterized protein n=1 Tax=Blomia tropicalis TaxID=40697 RepID=A0A9Q0MDM9_BLOTA|nr:hypothetical protein RDWZM_001758 [Blomia tropicalis]
MQRGSKVPMSDPLFETEDILRSLGLDDDMEETMEMDRVVWNSSIQTDVETKLLANRPPSTSAVVPSTTQPKAITSIITSPIAPSMSDNWKTFGSRSRDSRTTTLTTLYTNQKLNLKVTKSKKFEQSIETFEI